MTRDRRPLATSGISHILLALTTFTLLLASPHIVFAKEKSRSNRSSQKESKKGSSPKRTKPVPKGACISQGGRFLPFATHGKKPKKSPKAKKNELTFCRVYKDLTCCDRVNSDAAFLSVRMLQLGAEPSDECVALWEALECSLCHPSVGTQPGPPVVCQSFCDSLFDACRTAFFATDPVDKVFMPCSSRDSLCSRGTEWVNSSVEFCKLAGYDVINKSDIHAPAKFCFDGQLPGLSKGQTRGKGGGGGKGGGSRGEGFRGWFGGDRDWGTFFGQMVYWAVGGLVLTAGTIWGKYFSKKSRKRRDVVLAAKRAAEKAEVRARQQAQMTQISNAAANRRPKKAVQPTDDRRPAAVLGAALGEEEEPSEVTALQPTDSLSRRESSKA